MANIIREVLTQDQMRIPLLTAGQSKLGINLSGVWAGTVSFLGSTDGLNFGQPLAMVPFPPSGVTAATAVKSATANGSWESQALNYLAVAALFSRTSGSVVVTIGASIDSSYQDAFLVATSKYVTQKVAGGLTNVITQPAQVNRAWRLRSLSIGFSVASGAGVDLQISDGASSLLWEGTVPLSAGAGFAASGGTWLVPLPPVEEFPGLPNGGLVGTPGNSMVITLAAPGGSVVSTMNAEFQAA